MASPAKRLSMGPWSGGLVLLDRNAQMDALDNQNVLYQCNNLDVTDEGYLVSRAGCQRVGVVATHYTDASRVCKVLGSIFENGSLQAVLGIQVSGTSTKIYLTPDGYTLTFWKSVTGLISSVQQYGDWIYLIRSDTTGGYKVQTNFFTWPAGTPNAETTVSTLPKGDKTFIFKDRLFVIDKNTSTVNFSVPTDPTDYTVDNGGGYFIVNPSNDVGTAIMDVILTNETFYIFKRNQTYLFAYDANPNDDGVLRLINSALGAFSATVWENDIYVVNTQGVYRIVNGVFIRMDAQLDLRRNADLSNIIDPLNLTRPLFIHAAGGRLLIGQFGNTVLNEFGFNYVSMNLNNGAWSGYKYIADGSAPGGQGVTVQGDDVWGFEIYPSKNGNYFVRVPTMRGATDFNLDGRGTDATERRYLPNYSIIFPSYNAGFANLWKKIHRFFIRSLYYYASGTTPNNVVEIIYDNNVTAKDTIQWNAASVWETTRPQSQFKLAAKQHRFRNMAIKISNAGDATGQIYAVPPNVGKADPLNEFFLSGIDLDISFPRGMSTV